MAYRADILVGLDIGTKFGFAVAKNEQLVEGLFGTWNLAPRSKTKNFPADPPWWRIQRLETHLHRLILEQLPRYTSAAFVFEDITRAQGFSSTQGAKVNGALEAVMLRVLGYYGFTPTPYAVSTWKKLACGHGHADQPKYIKAANDRWGLELGDKDDNTAVAVNLISAHIRAQRAKDRG